MKKIYISPATDVFKVNICSVIMTSPGEAGSKVNISTELPEMDDTPGSGSGGGSATGDDLSRNGGGSIWDNAW